MKTRRLETDGLALSPRCNTALLQRTRGRILTVIIAFFIAYTCVALRLSYLTLLHHGEENSVATILNREFTHETHSAKKGAELRGKILDRQGNVLAMSVKTKSLYANPQTITNPLETAQSLQKIFPDLSLDTLVNKLDSERKFVWIKRSLSPQQAYAVNRLGIPGLDFSVSEERIYPHGHLFSHVLGFTNVDSHGIAGMERYFDKQLLSAPTKPVETSLDARVQHVLHKELSASMKYFNAIGAGGLVMDAQTGEVIAMVSLPDFHPMNIEASDKKTMFNRITKGVYEQGSTFKTFSVAAALESGKVRLSKHFDTTEPLRRAGFIIRDYHPAKRPQNAAEIYVESSNIGTALMAEAVGTDGIKAFFKSLGLLDRPQLELSEVGAPLFPERWGDIHTVTSSFGHGIAVSPLQLAAATASIVNDGRLVKPTLLKRNNTSPIEEAPRVVSPRVSNVMRQLMRLTVTDGTASKADPEGYRVGGKTGTAEKAVAGGYKDQALLSSFIGIFPTDAPRYVVFAMLDEPQGRKETWGYATGGWTAAPVVGKVIQQTAPLLGVAYNPESQRELSRMRYAMGVRPKQEDQLASY